jgi:hypothetical protein
MMVCCERSGGDCRGVGGGCRSRKLPSLGRAATATPQDRSGRRPADLGVPRHRNENSEPKITSAGQPRLDGRLRGIIALRGEVTTRVNRARYTTWTSHPSLSECRWAGVARAVSGPREDQMRGIVGVFRQLPCGIDVPSAGGAEAHNRHRNVTAPHYYAHPEGEQWNPGWYLSMLSSTSHSPTG